MITLIDSFLIAMIVVVVFRNPCLHIFYLQNVEEEYDEPARDRTICIYVSLGPVNMLKAPRQRQDKDLSLALLTKKFLRLLRGIHHGFIDLNLAAKNLITSKPRVYDLTNCLEGTNLIQKQDQVVRSVSSHQFCGAEAEILAGAAEPEDGGGKSR